MVALHRGTRGDQVGADGRGRRRWGGVESGGKDELG